MKIKVNGKLKYKDDGYTQKLVLKIYFKLPNKIFPVRQKRILTSSAWVGIDRMIYRKSYLSYDHFQEESLMYLKDQELLEKEARGMFNKYVKGKSEKLTHESNEAKIQDLVKNSKFTFDIEIKGDSK